MSKENAINGCLLGMAIGDALGLWCENLSARRIERMRLPLDQHHFLFGKGMISDDTEHLCMVGQALIASAGAPEKFQRTLAWRLRGWLLAAPAGIGLATLRSCLKLCLGFSGKSSGVFSAGNGPAMRSPLLGVCFGHDLPHLRELVRLSTRITHTDPKAEYGALAVALASYLSSHLEDISDLPNQYRAVLQEALAGQGQEFYELIDKAASSACAGQSPREFAQALGLHQRVSGYVYHTVPVVIQTWLRYPEDYRRAIPAIIACGGDTDTTAAILGAIIGARVGKAGIPQEWLDGIWEWPCSVRWMEQLGQRLAEVCNSGSPQKPLTYFAPGLPVRNLFFFGVVLAHVFRRCLPPY